MVIKQNNTIVVKDAGSNKYRAAIKLSELSMKELTDLVADLEGEITHRLNWEELEKEMNGA